MNAQNAHASALVIDRRHYVTVASNALLELRYVRATKLYMLHTVCASYKLDADTASAVYECVKRHTVRIARAAVSVRASVYTLRSDIRAVMRANECRMYAH
jgi:hypothetical protein